MKGTILNMLRHRTVQAIITDIEGTTTSLSFVKEVLFPYAKKHLKSYVQKNLESPEVIHCLNGVAQTLSDENSIIAPDNAQIIETLNKWIEEDRKHPSLKLLQGLIWASGYEKKKFTGHVYNDVPGFLENAKEANLPVYVYSSGSVAAQKLLFGYSDCGDLNEKFSGFYDTNVGAKLDPLSYERIVKDIGVTPEHVLFLSDVQVELDSAGQSGLQTTQILREGVSPAHGHPMAHDLKEFWEQIQHHL